MCVCVLLDWVTLNIYFNTYTHTHTQAEAHAPSKAYYFMRIAIEARYDQMSIDTPRKHTQTRAHKKNHKQQKLIYVCTHTASKTRSKPEVRGAAPCSARPLWQASEVGKRCQGFVQAAVVAVGVGVAVGAHLHLPLPRKTFALGRLPCLAPSSRGFNWRCPLCHLRQALHLAPPTPFPLFPCGGWA